MPDESGQSGQPSDSDLRIRILAFWMNGWHWSADQEADDGLPIASAVVLLRLAHLTGREAELIGAWPAAVSATGLPRSRLICARRQPGASAARRIILASTGSASPKPRTAAFNGGPHKPPGPLRHRHRPVSPPRSSSPPGPDLTSPTRSGPRRWRLTTPGRRRLSGRYWTATPGWVLISNQPRTAYYPIDGPLFVRKGAGGRRWAGGALACSSRPACPSQGGSGGDGDAASFGGLVPGAVGDLDGEREGAGHCRGAAQVASGEHHAGRELAGRHRPGERAHPAGGEEVLEVGRTDRPGVTAGAREGDRQRWCRSDRDAVGPVGARRAGAERGDMHGPGERALLGGRAADDGPGRAVGRGHLQARRHAAFGNREGVDGAVAGQQEPLIRLADRGGGKHADAVDQRAAVGAGRA